MPKFPLHICDVSLKVNRAQCASRLQFILYLLMHLYFDPRRLNKGNFVGECLAIYDMVLYIQPRKWYTSLVYIQVSKVLRQEKHASIDP
jgi:hypothetical protein